MLIRLLNKAPSKTQVILALLVLLALAGGVMTSMTTVEGAHAIYGSYLGLGMGVIVVVCLALASFFLGQVLVSRQWLAAILLTVVYLVFFYVCWVFSFSTYRTSNDATTGANVSRTVNDLNSQLQLSAELSDTVASIEVSVRTAVATGDGAILSYVDGFATLAGQLQSTEVVKRVSDARREARQTLEIESGNAVEDATRARDEVERNLEDLGAQVAANQVRTGELTLYLARLGSLKSEAEIAIALEAGHLVKAIALAQAAGGNLPERVRTEIQATNIVTAEAYAALAIEASEDGATESTSVTTFRLPEEGFAHLLAQDAESASPPVEAGNTSSSCSGIRAHGLSSLSGTCTVALQGWLNQLAAEISETENSIDSIQQANASLARQITNAETSLTRAEQRLERAIQARDALVSSPGEALLPLDELSTLQRDLLADPTTANFERLVEFCENVSEVARSVSNSLTPPATCRPSDAVVAAATFDNARERHAAYAASETATQEVFQEIVDDLEAELQPVRASAEIADGERYDEAVNEAFRRYRLEIYDMRIAAARGAFEGLALEALGLVASRETLGQQMVALERNLSGAEPTGEDIQDAFGDAWTLWTEEMWLGTVDRLDVAPAVFAFLQEVVMLFSKIIFDMLYLRIRRERAAALNRLLDLEVQPGDLPSVAAAKVLLLGGQRHRGHRIYPEGHASRHSPKLRGQMESLLEGLEGQGRARRSRSNEWRVTADGVDELKGIVVGDISVRTEPAPVSDTKVSGKGSGEPSGSSDGTVIGIDIKNKNDHLSTSETGNVVEDSTSKRIELAYNPAEGADIRPLGADPQPHRTQQQLQQQPSRSAPVVIVRPFADTGS